MDGKRKGQASLGFRAVTGAVLAGLTLTMAACGVVYLPGSNHRSEVLRQMSVEPHDPSLPFGGLPETPKTDEARLQEAAFSLLAGKSGPEAVAYLEGDGWTCAALTCNTTVVRQELPLTVGVRHPGPPRRFTTVWHLTLPAGRIAAPADVGPARTSMVEDAP